MTEGKPRYEGSPLEIAVNSHGIVLPPPPLPCLGEECKYSHAPEGCQFERHHLHIGEPVHIEHSQLAEDFRDLRVLTVWVPECVHDDLHNENPFSIKPPEDEVMRQVVHEDFILKGIGQNFSFIRTIREQMAMPDNGPSTRRKLDYAYKKYLSQHDYLLEGIKEIEIVPAQLVTGFLLIAAPKLARRRVIEKTGFALTASSKSFRPEVFDPVDDFILGGILHEGQEVRLRPNIVPFKPKEVREETTTSRPAQWSPAAATA